MVCHSACIGEWFVFVWILVSGLSLRVSVSGLSLC